MTLSQTLPTAVLETNRTPTSKERNVIKSLLEGTDQRLEEIHQKMTKYKEEEAALIAAKTSYICALSPVRLLPSDVLSEIFLACMDSPDFPAISPNEVPMLLTHICHDFRQLAFSMPALWMRIYIRFDPIKPRSSQDSERVIQRGRTLVDVTREWLHRSGKSPLYISFQASRGPFADLTNEMVEILLEYTARWKHISLSFLPGVTLIEQLAALTADDVPLLTSLALHHHHANRDHEYSNWDVLRAPNLKHFSMRGHRIASNMLNWSKVTSLELGLLVDTPIQTVAHILLQASNLVECRISFEYWTEYSANSGEIFLPDLELLELQGLGKTESWNPDRDISLLSCIHAPKLVRLRIASDVNEHGIETFLRRCPNLQEVVTLYKSPEPTLPEWLAFCPQITTLTLGLPNFGTHSDIVLRTLRHYSEKSMVPDDFYFQFWQQKEPNSMLGVLESFVLGKAGWPFLCPNLNTFICYFPVATTFETLCAFLQFQEGAGNLPHRQWKRVGLRATLLDGDVKKEGILLHKGHQWPMEFDFELM